MNAIYALVILLGQPPQWHAVMQFEHKAVLVAQFRCEVAAEQLELNPQHYRCIQTK